MGANTAASVKVAQATAYKTAATYQGLSSTTPGVTAPTEAVGGSPAYARKPTAWTGTNPISTVGTHDVAAGQVVAGATLWDALTAGNYLDGVGLTSQTFSSQGTYAATITVTVN